MKYHYYNLPAAVALLIAFPFLVGFGEKPTWDNAASSATPNVSSLPIPVEEEVVPDTPDQTTEGTSDSVVISPDEAPAGDESVRIIRADFRRALQQKNFPLALETLNKIPPSELTSSERDIKRKLDMFGAIENEANQSSAVFQSEQELDELNRRTVLRLYREAQYAYINGEDDIARDLLIHVIYVHRRNLRARKFLEEGLSLHTGEYKVENMESKYWQQSEIHFYGGNYSLALRDLEILTYFDRENPLIYERMGSSYYMMNLKKQAVESWNTALFLNPGNKDLTSIVEKAKALIEKDEEEAKKRALAREQKVEKETVKNEDTQLLGVFPSQTQAYNYAQKLRSQRLTAYVEELDNGKWAVKVPKDQINKPQ